MSELETRVKKLESANRRLRCWLLVGLAVVGCIALCQSKLFPPEARAEVDKSIYQPRIQTSLLEIVDEDGKRVGMIFGNGGGAHLSLSSERGTVTLNAMSNPHISVSDADGMQRLDSSWLSIVGERGRKKAAETARQMFETEDEKAKTRLAKQLATLPIEEASVFLIAGDTSASMAVYNIFGEEAAILTVDRKNQGLVVVNKHDGSVGNSLRCP